MSTTKMKIAALIIGPLPFVFIGSIAMAEVKESKRGAKTVTSIKARHSSLVAKFTSSPLRNRIRILLSAPPAEVWRLVGDIARLPEYSAGLAKVDVKKDSSGKPVEFICHFKPQKEGEAGVVSQDKVHWYEPERGFASSGAKDEVFGLKSDLHLVLLKPYENGTILTWDAYYDARDLPMMKAHYDEALGDIGQNLIKKFGGKMTERYIEGQ